MVLLFLYTSPTLSQTVEESIAALNQRGIAQFLDVHKGNNLRHIQNLLYASNSRFNSLHTRHDPGKDLPVETRERIFKLLTNVNPVMMEQYLEALFRFESIFDGVKGYHDVRIELEYVWRTLIKNPNVRQWLLRKAGNLNAIWQVAHNNVEWWAIKKIKYTGRLESIGASSFERAINVLEESSQYNKSAGEVKLQVLEFVNDCIETGLHKKHANGRHLMERLNRVVESLTPPSNTKEAYRYGIALQEYLYQSSNSRAEVLGRFVAKGPTLSGEAKEGFYNLGGMKFNDLIHEGKFADAPITEFETKLAERFFLDGLKFGPSKWTMLESFLFDLGWEKHYRRSFVFSNETVQRIAKIVFSNEFTEEYKDAANTEYIETTRESMREYIQRVNLNAPAGTCEHTNKHTSG